MSEYSARIAQHLHLAQHKVANAISLLKEGATIPFIARYRKEKTGGLDEVQIADIQDVLAKIEALESRRASILKSIQEQGQLSESLRKQILAADDLQTLEDLYLPFKPDRKSKGAKAKALGLKPLADIILKQREYDIEFRARDFVQGEVKDAKQALEGARDIIAEQIATDFSTRQYIRDSTRNHGFISSKVKRNKLEEGIRYKDYFKFEESIKRAPSHRILAMLRGEKEGFLKLKLEADFEKSVAWLKNKYVEKWNSCGKQIGLAIDESYKRLLQPGIESELKQELKSRADEEAILVFAENARQLLLASPYGQKRVLAIDPGYRTGCKVVCLDENGSFLKDAVIFPDRRIEEAKSVLAKLIEEFKVEGIAVGNGTAGRETFQFVNDLPAASKLDVFMVNEDGASIYSASEAARNEFPKLDITVRGSISIGRRLIDPLAELVKIDPKSIGVGQYQHDVNQVRLREQLDRVVVYCVNHVGVNVNTASKHLLAHVAGLGPSLAENIVVHRIENGTFTNRNELKKVPRMGAKSFEQAAGFLRINGGNNVLDATSVHPESYSLVSQMAKDSKLTTGQLIGNVSVLKHLESRLSENDRWFATQKDILAELAKPGQDPRQPLASFRFDPRIKKVEDLVAGMRLPGIVTNLTNFGAFVDIGVKQDGLIHISQITNRFIKSPSDELSIGQHVSARVTEIDLVRKRIGLSLLD
ncbi:MAG: hypothetical protein ACI8ZN_002242 [Bacteroidia bacterium]|jgi:uncharacterized protein